MTLKIEGHRYGRLLVLGRVSGTKTQKARWRCLCDCGTECAVFGNSLRTGKTRSCGCLQSEVAAGQCRSPEFIAKNVVAHKGVPMPLGSRAEAGENNFGAKSWWFKKGGKEYRFINLRHFIRCNKNLFDDEDLEPYKSRKDKCRASVMLPQLFLYNKNGTPRIPSFNWKGWTPVDKKEDQ